MILKIPKEARAVLVAPENDFGVYNMDCMNELLKPDIEIANHAGIGVYNANKEAMDRIKALSDKDFEKEISQFPEDTQMFMRLAREHNNEA